VAREFHYRLARRTPGWRPGSHRGASLGSGQEFIAHERLYDRPDPRRLDLRASLANIERQWLVRSTRQRASINVQVIVDVSASMSFGPNGGKLAMAADFLEALGNSAFRAGDTLSMLAFDSRLRTDLYVAPLRGRGMGEMMARQVLESRGAAGDGSALQDTSVLMSRAGLVFLLSDFHWPLQGLRRALDPLVHSLVVPLVLWSSAELQPPAEDGFAPLRDVESGRRRALWIRPQLRSEWRASVVARREQLAATFQPRGIRPFYVIDRFNSAALSRYFFELAG
jgi:hypothetical protein